MIRPSLNIGGTEYSSANPIANMSNQWLYRWRDYSSDGLTVQWEEVTWYSRMSYAEYDSAGQMTYLHGMYFHFVFGANGDALFDSLEHDAPFDFSKATKRDAYFQEYEDITPMGGNYDNEFFGWPEFTSITLRSASVPEPRTLALFGLGLAGIGCQRRNRAA